MQQSDYFKGKENWGIRMYFYLNAGLNIINQFRNLILGIFALYYTLKLVNPLWLVVMFAVSVPILVAVGYYNVHRMAKVSEWLSTKFSTHYAIKQFELTQKTVKLLESLNKKIK